MAIDFWSYADYCLLVLAPSIGDEHSRPSPSAVVARHDLSAGNVEAWLERAEASAWAVVTVDPSPLPPSWAGHRARALAALMNVISRRCVVCHAASLTGLCISCGE